MNSSCNSSLPFNASCGGSTKPIPPWYTNAFNVSMVILYTMVIISALVGNILVCIAISINQNLRQNVASYFIVSLAVSDIGTASFAMPFDLEAYTTELRKWYHGEVLCIVWTTAYQITVPSSIWNLFIMSIDRYKTLKNPWNRFKETHSMTARRAIATIIALWIYCLAFALLPVAGWKFKAYPQSVKKNYCRFNIARYLSIGGSFLNFYLPMFAMCGIYYKVYKIAHAHKKFPLSLESRFQKGSTNESQTASILSVPGGSLSRPSIADQQLSHDSMQANLGNKEDIKSIGLENVSFYFEDDSAEQHSSRNESENKRGNISVGKRASVGTKHHGGNSARGHFETHRTLKDNVKYCCEPENKLSTANESPNSKHDKESPNSKHDKESCLQQRKDHQDMKTHRDSLREKCKNTKFAESNVKQNPNPAESMLSTGSIAAESMLSTGSIEAVSERLSSSESRETAFTRESSFEQSHNDNTCNPLKSDSVQAQPGIDKKKSLENPAKSSRENLPKEKEKHFPLEKKLKDKSPYLAEAEFCSLRKFKRKSVEIPTLSAASGNSPGDLSKTNDSLQAYANKKRLKHFSKNTKAARTISIIVGAFLICWIPFTSMSVGFNICGEPCYPLVPPKLFDVLLLLGYLNSAINPILFSYQNMQFRKSFRQIARFLFRV